MADSIIVSSGGSGGGASSGNASVGPNGGVGPTSSTQIGDVVAGVFTPFGPANPIPISGTILANNSSVGPTGSAVPLDATYLGVENGSGNLVGVSASNPIRIDPTGTTVQPVSGTIAVSNFPTTVAVTQSTSPWVVSGTVTITPSGLQNVNVTNWNTVALGSPTAYGTAPGAVNVIGVNAFITNTPAVTLASTTITGTVAVTQSTSPWVVSNAGTFAVQVSSGTITATIPTPTNWGTAPATSVAVPAVNAEMFAGQIALSAAAASTVAIATQPSLVVQVSPNQPSALFAGTVPGTAPANTILVGQIFNTAAPAPTNGQTLPLQSDASGNLKVTGSITGALTNNNAAPIGNNIGALVAVASAGAPTYTAGDQVLLSTDLSGALRVNVGSVVASNNITEWNSVALGSPTAYGTAPTGNVIGVNAFITNTPAVTLASTTITGSVAVTGTFFQATQPVSGTVAVSNFPTSTSITGVVGVSGTLTNNNAAPAGNNIGALTAIAETAYTSITYTTGDMVLPVVDLHGAINTDLQAVAGTAVVAAAAGIQKVGVVGNTGAAFDAAPGTAIPTNAIYIAGRTAGGFLEGLFLDDSSNLNDDLQAVAGVALGATAVTAFGTAPAAVNVPGVNASLFAGTTAISQTGGSLNVNVTNTPSANPIAGNLTNNNAAPAAGNLGVLPAIAETAWATATYATGNQVLPAVDTHGAAWTDLGAIAGTTVGTVAAGVQKVGIVGGGGIQLDGGRSAATAPSNGLLTLVNYNSTAPALTSGQSVATECNSAGSLFVKPFRRSETKAQGTTIASSAGATNILPVGGAGIFVDLSALVITVAALAAAATPIPFTASLSDGTNTYIYDLQADALGTSVLISNPAPPLNLAFNPPIPAAAAATQWTITLSVATVTVHITAVGILQAAS